MEYVIGAVIVLAIVGYFIFDTIITNKAIDTFQSVIFRKNKKG